MSSETKNIGFSNIFSQGIKVVVVFFMFGFGYLPPIYPLERLGMQVLGVFIGLLIAWTFIGFIWPSLLGMIALGLTDYATMNNVFMYGFGNLMPLFVLFVSIYSVYLEDTGLMRKLAFWFLSRKICYGRPWAFTFMLLLTAYIMSALVGVFVAIFLVWEIFYNICGVVGYQKGEKYPAYIVLGIVIAAILGLAIIPFKAVPLLVITMLKDLSGGMVVVGYAQYFAIAAIVTLIILCLYFLTCKYVLRLDVSKLEAIQDEVLEMRKNTSLNASQKFAFTTLISYTILLFMPSLLPKTWWIGRLFGSLDILGVLVLIIIILCVITKEGKPIMNFQKYATAKSINWDMIVMLAATMAVSGAISNAEVGIIEALKYYIFPIIERVNPTLFSLVIVIGALLATQLVHNLVLAVMLTPLIYTLGVEMNITTVSIFIVMMIGLSVAIVTPAASSMGALCYTNKEWVSVKEAYIGTSLTVLFTGIVMALVGLPLANLVV